MREIIFSFFFSLFFFQALFSMSKEIEKKKESNNIVSQRDDEHSGGNEKSFSEMKNVFSSESKSLINEKSELFNVQNNHLVLTKKLRGEITDLEFNMR
jgi:hypothetical protein